MGKIQNFIRSSNQLTPSPDTGANTLPPFGESFMYIETSSNNHREGFFSFERTHISQINKISFYYNRYSAENDHKAIGRFRIQLLLTDNTWSVRYNLSKNDYYTKQSE